MCSRRVGKGRLSWGPAGIAVVASQCNDSLLPAAQPERTGEQENRRTGEKKNRRTGE